jgi:hypothetical protein
MESGYKVVAIHGAMLGKAEIRQQSDYVLRLAGGSERVIDTSSRLAVIDMIDLAREKGNVQEIRLYGPWRIADPRRVHADASPDSVEGHFLNSMDSAKGILQHYFPEVRVTTDLNKRRLAKTNWQEPMGIRRIRLGCMDYRLNQQFAATWHDDTLFLRAPGGASALNNGRYRGLMEGQIVRVIDRLAMHGSDIVEVILGNHYDCAALNGKEPTDAREIAKHEHEILAAAAVVRDIFSLCRLPQPAIKTEIRFFDGRQVLHVDLTL